MPQTFCSCIPNLRVLRKKPNRLIEKVNVKILWVTISKTNFPILVFNIILLLIYYIFDPSTNVYLILNIF